MVAERAATAHFEYNRAGDRVCVSVWDREGEVVVSDDETLDGITQITGDGLVTPTGEFSVYDTAHDIY